MTRLLSRLRQFLRPVPVRVETKKRASIVDEKHKQLAREIGWTGKGA